MPRVRGRNSPQRTRPTPRTGHAKSTRASRKARAHEVLYGVHPVAEALGANRRELFGLRLRAGRQAAAIEALVARAEALKVPVVEISAEDLRTLAGPEAVTQGVALEVGPLPLASLERLSEQGKPPRRIVAIDGVEDPQNLGAIARVAEAAGAAGLLMTERRAPPLGPAVAKASAGAIERLPVARVPNLVSAIKRLKSKGYWIFGSDPTEGRDLFSLPDGLLTGDVVVIFSAEGRGLRPGLRKVLDHVLRVPMRGEIGSLNVSTAAAVVLFDWVRRFGAGGAPEPGLDPQA